MDDVVKTNHVDILIFTSNPPSGKELDRLREKTIRIAGLSQLHPVDVHFENKKVKNEALNKAKFYKPLML